MLYYTFSCDLIKGFNENEMLYRLYKMTQVHPFSRISCTHFIEFNDTTHLPFMVYKIYILYTLIVQSSSKYLSG